MSTKIKECPECGERLHSDCWIQGRMLQQHCEECGWKGKPRIPETQEIKDTREARTGQFYGWHYEIFDKYGHYLTISRYYPTRKEATDEMDRQLTRDNEQPDLSPCTAILWPDKVLVQGEIFK